MPKKWSKQFSFYLKSNLFEIAQRGPQIFGQLLEENLLLRSLKIAQSGHTVPDKQMKIKQTWSSWSSSSNSEICFSFRIFLLGALFKLADSSLEGVRVRNTLSCLLSTWEQKMPLWKKDVRKSSTSSGQSYRGSKINMAITGLFLFIFTIFKHKFDRKTVDVSRIRTRIVRVDGKYADQLTITTTPSKRCLYEWKMYRKVA